MKDVNELRARLAAVFDQAEKGELKSSTVAELTNIAGKMIGSAKIELEYRIARKENPTIRFLHCANDDGTPPDEAA